MYWLTIPNQGRFLVSHGALHTQMLPELLSEMCHPSTFLLPLLLLLCPPLLPPPPFHSSDVQRCGANHPNRRSVAEAKRPSTSSDKDHIWQITNSTIQTSVHDTCLAKIVKLMSNLTGSHYKFDKSVWIFIFGTIDQKLAAVRLLLRALQTAVFNPYTGSEVAGYLQL